MATVTVWRFDIAIGAGEAVNTLHDLTKQQRITVQDLRLRRTLALPMMLTNDSTRVNMSDPERAGADHQSHRTAAEAHPERAVDELEEQVLGRRMDQVRDDDVETAHDQNRDEQTPGTEQP